MNHGSLGSQSQSFDDYFDLGHAIGSTMVNVPTEVEPSPLLPITEAGAQNYDESMRSTDNEYQNDCQNNKTVNNEVQSQSDIKEFDPTLKIQDKQTGYSEENQNDKQVGKDTEDGGK